jgi:hypothetical protein
MAEIDFVEFHDGTFVPCDFDDVHVPEPFEIGWIPPKPPFVIYANGAIEFASSVNLPVISEDDDFATSSTSASIDLPHKDTGAELVDGLSDETDLDSQEREGLSVSEGEPMPQEDSTKAIKS